MCLGEAHTHTQETPPMTMASHAPGEIYPNRNLKRTIHRNRKHAPSRRPSPPTPSFFFKVGPRFVPRQPLPGKTVTTARSVPPQSKFRPTPGPPLPPRTAGNWRESQTELNHQLESTDRPVLCEALSVSFPWHPISQERGPPSAVGPSCQKFSRVLSSPFRHLH